MGLFNWGSQKQCGEDTSPACDKIPETSAGRAFVVINPQSQCPSELIPTEYPALGIALGPEIVELRSGSKASPIPLERLQEYNGKTDARELLIRNISGQMVAWNPPPDCADNKVIFDGQKFRLKPDVNSNVFEEACIGSIADVDYIAGGKGFTDCNGVSRLKLVFFPKSELPSGS